MTLFCANTISNRSAQLPHRLTARGERRGLVAAKIIGSGFHILDGIFQFLHRLDDSRVLTPFLPPFVRFRAAVITHILKVVGDGGG